MGFFLFSNNDVMDVGSYNECLISCLLKRFCSRSSAKGQWHYGPISRRDFSLLCLKQIYISLENILSTINNKTISYNNNPTFLKYALLESGTSVSTS